MMYLMQKRVDAVIHINLCLIQPSVSIETIRNRLKLRQSSFEIKRRTTSLHYLQTLLKATTTVNKTSHFQIISTLFEGNLTIYLRCTFCEVVAVTFREVFFIFELGDPDSDAELLLLLMLRGLPIEPDKVIPLISWRSPEVMNIFCRFLLGLGQVPLNKYAD